MNASKNLCPNCSKPKKPWFSLCFECSEKEKQKPRCEVCTKEVPQGHTLCKEHWLENENKKAKLNGSKGSKLDFKEKFEGKFYFNSQRVKSKSELIICYFLAANNIIFSYEPRMEVDGKEIRPDFAIDDSQGNTIILEHFGLDTVEYKRKRELKEQALRKLCAMDNSYFFVSTEEDDICNLKDNLGRKLNTTPIKKVRWK